MRDYLDLFIVVLSAGCAIYLFRGAWIESRSGKPIPFLLPGMPPVYRRSSPKLFKVRMVGILVAALTFFFGAIVLGAVWFGLI